MGVLIAALCAFSPSNAALTVRLWFPDRMMRWSTILSMAVGALIHAAGAALAQGGDASLTAARDAAIADSRYCAGCIPNARLLRIELLWPLDGARNGPSSDLDLHTWSPPRRPGAARFQNGWNRKVDNLRSSYRCDDQGQANPTCSKRGERVNVQVEGFIFDDAEDRAYCLGVHHYSGGRPSFSLTITPTGAPGIACHGAASLGGPPGLATSEAAALVRDGFAVEVCGTRVVGLDRNLMNNQWVAFIAFHAPRPGAQLGLDDVSVLRGLTCEETATGETRAADDNG